MAIGGTYPLSLRGVGDCLIAIANVLAGREVAFASPLVPLANFLSPATRSDHFLPLLPLPPSTLAPLWDKRIPASTSPGGRRA